MWISSWQSIHPLPNSGLPKYDDDEHACCRYSVGVRVLKLLLTPGRTSLERTQQTALYLRDVVQVTNSNSPTTLWPVLAGTGIHNARTSRALEKNSSTKVPLFPSVQEATIIPDRSRPPAQEGAEMGTVPSAGPPWQLWHETSTFDIRLTSHAQGPRRHTFREWCSENSTCTEAQETSAFRFFYTFI